jgi:hypothetical protein
MTEQRAVQIANVVIGVAAVGVAYYVLRTPALRRTARQIATTALVTTLPGWFNRELRQAWADSATERDMMSA